jgi:hypothetical protein
MLIVDHTVIFGDQTTHFERKQAASPGLALTR